MGACCSRQPVQAKAGPGAREAAEPAVSSEACRVALQSERVLACVLAHVPPSQLAALRQASLQCVGEQAWCEGSES